MTQIIPTLLSITMGSALTAGLIILVRLLLKNILSAKAKYYLWLLLALRLMLPALPESSFSLMNLIPEPQAAQIETEAAAENTSETVLPNLEPTVPESTELPTIVTQAPAVNTDFYPEPEVSYSLTPEGWLLVIWISGMAVVLLGYITLYSITGLRLHKLPECHDDETLETFQRLKQELGIHRNIRLSIGGGGMLGGFFRPTIVLPAECYGQSAKPILIHELFHYKHKDLWIYLLFRLLTAVYWFNPLVWLCFHQARQDSEAACDQRVMDSGLVETIVYAEVLYREGILSRRDRMLMQTSFGGSKHSLRKRISAISRYNGKHLWVTLLAICLAVVICACTLTSKEAGSPAEPTASSNEAVVSDSSLHESVSDAKNPDPVHSNSEHSSIGEVHLSLHIAGDNTTEANSFTTNQLLGFSLIATVEATDDKKHIETTYIIRDAAGDAVHTLNSSKTWPGDWTTLEHTGQIPEMPQVPGEYSFEIYFDDDLIAEKHFTVTVADEEDTFFALFHELDKTSMLDYVAANPEAISNGWSQLEINEAGLDDAGTGIMTTNGHEVLAIDAPNGILLLRVYCENSRGVMAILKDSSRLINAPATTIGSSGQTVGTICEHRDGLVAINGSALLDDDNGSGGLIAGSAVCSGERLGESLDGTYKRLELRDDGRMYIMDATSAISNNTLEACEFKPALIIDGQILVDENCGWTSPSPRTAIGQSARLETMMVVIEGRMLDAPGSSVVDIAELMAMYDCAQALNLDGGTSSVMYYKGEYITRCSNTALPEGRKLPTAWVYR